MDGLVIAAGYGSRLAQCTPSKPLVTVAGVPLIELVVRQLAGAGVRRVVVVTGHAAEPLEALLADLARRSGIEIVPERLDDWSKPNGWSVLAGARRI
ncbi:MAG: NTP transferase domain-containing protein, partial [Novosphingobium sp.]